MAASRPAEAPSPPRKAARRRLTGDERRAEILAEAALLFAEEGFGASTRRLAARMGISQAALYKHFAGKDQIIQALFEERASRWSGKGWEPDLSAADVPLVEVLGDLYARFVGRITGPSMRLFVRAGLEGYGQPARRGARLTALILEPVIGALRREAGLPGFAASPMRHEERELAMALHGAVVFLAIRKHIYRMPMLDDLDTLARRQVRLWLPGALLEVKAMHEAGSPPPVPQLAPRG